MPGELVKTSKRYLYKVYDSGDRYLTTWDGEISTAPSFEWAINGGLGELVIDLTRVYESVQSTDDTIPGNRIQCFVLDKDSSEGVQVFDGILTKYDIIVSQDGTQFVRIYVSSWTKTLQDILLKNGTATTVAYSSQDPSAILRDIIDKYAGKITYRTVSPQSIFDTGTSVTYTFSYMTVLECIDKVQELSPAFWYWYVGPDNLIYFRVSSEDTPDHSLYVGKQVVELQGRKSIEELYNVVYFLGGGDPPLYYKYSSTGSITEYGTREYKMQDGRVTVAASAEILATKFLNEHNSATNYITAKVVDNSFDTRYGYDIESFRPGQVVTVFTPEAETVQSLWDVSFWDEDYWDWNPYYLLGRPMQIQSIQYNFDSCTLELADRLKDVTHRLEELSEEIEAEQATNIPSTPS